MKTNRKNFASLTKTARKARADRVREAKRAKRAHVKTRSRTLVKATRAAVREERKKAKQIADAKKRVLAACAAGRAFLLEAKKEIRSIVSGYQRRVAKIDKADEEFCEMLTELVPGTSLDGDAFGAALEAVDAELASLKEYLGTLEGAR